MHRLHSSYPSRLSFYTHLSALVSSVAATCYFPSGLTAEHNSAAFAPCNSKPGAVSMCCNFENGDSCTPEGLCLSGVAYYRDMCTDQTWQAPECIRQCMDVWNPRITSCDDGTWCCGAENITCCSQSRGFKILATTTGTFAFTLTAPASTGSTSESVITSAQSSSGTTTILESSTSYTGSSPTTAPVSISKSKDNSVVIGAGVGVPLGVILVALVVGYCIWKRRRQYEKRAVKYLDVEGAGLRTTEDKKPGRKTYMTSAESPLHTRCTSEGSVDGDVMSATGSAALGIPQLANSNSIHSIGSEVHEIDLGIRDRVHELPVDGQRKREDIEIK